MQLAAAFRAEVGVDGAHASDAELEARLGELLGRGRSAHPDLALDGLAFIRQLARCAADARATTTLEQLHVEDLYLACACAAGAARAAARFEERCGPRLTVAIAATVRSPDLRAEVRQRVLERLLVGTVDVPAKISTYAGQGPLDSWAAVAAQRLLANLLRADATEQRARDGAAVEAVLGPAVAPEVAFAKQRYRVEFERAMADALLVLDERDRLLLRLQLVSQISVEAIGKMYGVAQATASRWLASARDRVQAEVVRLLRERLGASTDEIASLVGVVASQLDMSMSRLLGPSGGRGA